MIKITLISIFALYLLICLLSKPLKFKTGTKSILYGVHCFWLHPFFVAYAWCKLYGFPLDIRIWFAFFVHDLGYFGCEKMDDEKGEMHPYFGAKIMHFLFDGWYKCFNVWSDGYTGNRWFKKNTWYYFTLCHSRFLAKKIGMPYSKLCVADKYCIVVQPWWLYKIQSNLSGEIKEYMKDASKNSNGAISVQKNQRIWHFGVKEYVAKWVLEHKYLKEDNWTKSDRNKNADVNDVWK